MPNLRGGESEADYFAWVEFVLRKRELVLRDELIQLYELAELLLEGLDGDFIADMPELVGPLFAGYADPWATAHALERLWMAWEKLNLDDLTWMEQAVAILDGPGGSGRAPVCELHRVLRENIKTRTPK